jgi:transposase
MFCQHWSLDMRGSDERNGSLFSFVDIEDRVPARHPLRKILEIVNAALATMDTDFARLYAANGRPSIAPERLLRAAMIQILFSIRSERQLMEQMQYNLLFRWFVGLGIDDPVWVATVFSKNRDRLLNTDIARKFLAAILAHKEVAPLLSDDHFSVDGTLVEAWASMKSFQPRTGDGDSDAPPLDATDPGGCIETHATKTTDTSTTANEITPMTTTNANDKVEGDRNVDVDFRGQKRSNVTHVSRTDPQARLYRKGKGKPSQLCYMGHALMENRHGLIVEAELTQADGYGERAAAITMIERHSPGSTRRITLGADKGYDTSDFVADLRRMCVSPHIAAKSKGSAIDRRTTRHDGYAVSQKKRKQIEEPFGWGKTVGPIRKTMLRGLERVGAQFTLTMAACNLARLPRLLAA